METVFIWASPHQITNEQLSSLENLGEVYFLQDENPMLFREMCNSPDNVSDLLDLANNVEKEIKDNFDAEDDEVYIVQPAGSPAFQYALGRIGVNVIYAHSKRVSEDTVLPDRTIKKVSIFKHEGWIGL